MSFSELDLHSSLLRSLSRRGFQAPTPIQRDAIPVALEGGDVVACAATGSGKTAAFLLPLLQRLLDTPGRGTRALVLAPTRELAAQIADEARQLAPEQIRLAAVVGGVSASPQQRALRAGVDLLIATPGRLLDHVRSGHARLGGVSLVVLDEADRMLDMGFLPDVRRILGHLGKERQTLLFSATLPPAVARLCDEMLRSPRRIGTERSAAPPSGVRQAAYRVASDKKSSLLVELLRRGVVGEALAFTRTKHRADRLARFLSANGIRADRIHGNRSQGQRTAALAAFKSGKLRVLVATDIAARGIDVEALGHVVNFDLPKCAEDYIHRVGRTGRASATGDALTFVAPEEEGELRRFERLIGSEVARHALDDFDHGVSDAAIAAMAAAATRAGASARAPRREGPPRGRSRGRRPRRRPVAS